MAEIIMELDLLIDSQLTLVSNPLIISKIIMIKRLFFISIEFNVG